MRKRQKFIRRILVLIVRTRLLALVLVMVAFQNCARVGQPAETSNAKPAVGPTAPLPKN